MKKKAEKFANAKIFACHSINVKTTMMWNFIKSNEKNIFMLNNSFQSIHDVFLYRVEHDKKNLTVNLLYEFDRTIDEKISKNFICYVIICKKRLFQVKNMFNELISSSVASRVMTTSSSRVWRLLFASYDSQNSMIITLRFLLFRIHLRT
jgi:hypothetical protein